VASYNPDENSSIPSTMRRTLGLFLVGAAAVSAGAMGAAPVRTRAFATVSPPARLAARDACDCQRQWLTVKWPRVRRAVGSCLKPQMRSRVRARARCVTRGVAQPPPLVQRRLHGGACMRPCTRTRPCAGRHARAFAGKSSTFSSGARTSALLLTCFYIARVSLRLVFRRCHPGCGAVAGCRPRPCAPRSRHQGRCPPRILCRPRQAGPPPARWRQHHPGRRGP
jgi:hypothetical protein